MEQDRRVLPELLKLVDERVLQLIERCEDGIGELLAQMPQDLRSLVQFGTLGRQRERMQVLWPSHLAAAMTA